MLIGERMSRPVITVSPDMPIVDALNLMKSEHIRRAPVMKGKKLVGIVSDKDLMNASPSQATSLSVWEINYLLSKIKVNAVMSKKVLTVNEDTPIEDAARIMADNKIGGLPVMRNGEIVGIITETDLFKIFLELMGVRYAGVRATILLAEQQGKLAQLTQAIAKVGGNFVAFGMFQGESTANRILTFKVDGMEMEQVRAVIEPISEGIIDLRYCTP